MEMNMDKYNAESERLTPHAVGNDPLLEWPVLPWPEDVWPTTIDEAGSRLRAAMGDNDTTAISGALMRHGWLLAEQAFRKWLKEEGFPAPHATGNKADHGMGHARDTDTGQPQRGNQEWTSEWLATLFEKNFIGDTIKAIMGAHNAALAAERERILLEVSQDRTAMGHATKVEQIALDLRQKLAAEHQRREQAEEQFAADRGMFQATKETLLEQLTKTGEQLLECQRKLNERDNQKHA